MNRPRWLEIALARTTVKRAARIGIAVGALLIAINHGSDLLGGQVTPGQWLQMGLTIPVPYLVSTASTVQATIEFTRGDLTRRGGSSTAG